MKNRILIAFCAIFMTFHASSQIAVYKAKQLQAIDSIKLVNDWIKSISKDSAFVGVTDKDIPSALAVKKHLSGSLLGYVPITRTINGYPLSTNISLNKTDVGLGNVDNTSDANKPVSTAQAASIATKQATLVSGSNIKTVNSNNLLGSGDISVASLVGFTPENVANKNANNGYAGLDAGGKVPFSLLPATLMIYKGLWDATTNSPSLTNGVGTAGHVYKISNSGGQYYVGNRFGVVDTLWNDDFIIYNGSAWEVSGETNNVKSVNNQQGIVTLTTANIAENTNLYYTDARVLSYGNTQWVRSVGGTAGKIFSSGGLNPVLTIDAAYNGQSSITNVGTLTIGTWNATPITDTYISSAATWNAKQAQLNGTGFVKASGTTISYDNSTYLTGINASLVNAVGTISNNTTGNAATATSWLNAGTYSGSTEISSPSAIMTYGGSAWGYTSLTNFRTWLGLGSYAYRSSGLAELSGAAFTGTLDAQAAGGQISISGGGTKAGLFMSSSNSLLKLTDWNTGTLGLTIDLANSGAANLSGALTGTSANFSSTLNATGEITTGSVSRAFIRQNASGDTEIGSKAGGTLSLWSDNTSRVLINDVSLTSNLPINGTSASFSGAVTGASLNVTTSSNGLGTINTTNATGGYMTWQTNGVTIADIGTATQVFGSGGSEVFAINGRGARDIAFGTNNIERFRIASSGAASFTSSLAAASGTFTYGTSIPNGAYYKANRLTGGAEINILGIESGTDNTVMVASNFFKVRNTGGGDGANLFTVDNSGNGVFTGNASAANAYISNAITAYSVGLNGSSGGWARHYSFIGSTGTNRGGFGAFGSDNSLSYYYIGNAYNDNKLQIDGTTGAATFSSNVTATQFLSSSTSGYLVRDGSVAGYGLYKSSTTSIGIASNGSVVLDITSTGSIYASSLAGTGDRMVVANSSGALSTQAIPSGGGTGTTYTPTISNGTGASATSLVNNPTYTVVGNVVTVRGAIYVTPTAASNSCLINMTLPLTASSTMDLVGTGSYWQISNSATSNLQISISTTTQASIFFVAPATVSAGYVYFVITYSIP